MRTKRLSELTRTIRSTNAGPEKITVDILFKDQETYEFVKKHKVFSKQMVANVYGIQEERICNVVEFDPAFGIKFTMYRETPSGNPGDTDIFGCQQYVPLLDIEVPVE